MIEEAVIKTTEKKYLQPDMNSGYCNELHTCNNKKLCATYFSGNDRMNETLNILESERFYVKIYDTATLNPKNLRWMKRCGAIGG